MNDDTTQQRTQMIGNSTGQFDPYQNPPPRTGATQMGGTINYDPNRTQMAPPPTMTPYNNGGASGGPTLSLTVRVGNRFAASGERTRQHVLTQVSAGAGAAARWIWRRDATASRERFARYRPLRVDGRRTAGIRQAGVFPCCGFAVAGRCLSIVTFEETVDVIMPARRVSDPNLIKQHIARIVPGNTTNLFDGLYAGGAQAASVPLAGYVTRVLLLTDGEPTAGLRDFQSIVNQVGDLKARGVTVTALGFGPEYNEELMAGIARKSGGNYYYIARPEEIPDVFRREMQTILGVTAKNAKLTLRSAARLFGSASLRFAAQLRPALRPNYASAIWKAGQACPNCGKWIGSRDGPAPTASPKRF